MVTSHRCCCVSLPCSTEQQQGLAAYLLTQAALMHAAAYTLSKVSEHSDWTPVLEPGYELVPFSRCCGSAKNLPLDFVKAVQAWGETLGASG